MPIQGKCHGCGKLLQVAEEYAGRVAKCPHCGATFKVPAPAATPPAGSPLAETAVATPLPLVVPAQPARESLSAPAIPTAPSEQPAPTAAALSPDSGNMGALLGGVEDRLAARRAPARSRPAARKKSSRPMWLAGGIAA